jgi:cytosine/adenosine deaminase-related metal-dependent hydrolase
MAEVHALGHHDDYPRKRCVECLATTHETRAQVIARLERLGSLEPGCPGCAELYAAPNPLAVCAPRHTASRRCESGKRAHCTCDVCF